MANDQGPKPINLFPFMHPGNLSDRERVRMELMADLNKWDLTHPDIARRTAETLILLLQEQFGIGVGPLPDIAYIPGSVQNCAIMNRKGHDHGQK